MIGLCLTLVLTAVGTWHVACALGLRRPVDTVTAWLLAGTAQLTGLTLLVGGALWQLNAWGLAIATIVVVAAEIVVARRFRDDVRRSAQKAVATRLGGAKTFWRHPILVLLGVLVLGQYAWRAAIGTAFGPLDWDGLWYHVTGPDIWLQNGHVGHTSDVLWADVYPQGQELLTAWAGVFLGTTRYAWTSNIPFILLGLSAIAGLARSAGASRKYAVLAAFGFFAVPAVFLQASTSYVDVAAAAASMAALQLVIASRDAAVAADASGGSARAALFRYLALTGVALGLAIGVKSSNLLVGGFVVLAGLIQVWCVAPLIRRGGDTPEEEEGRVLGARLATTVRLAVPGALLVGVPTLLLGSYWYVRTWLRYDNPFYPFTMFGFQGEGTVHDLIIVPNTPARWLDQGAAETTLDSWWHDRSRHAYTYDVIPGGFGLQWLAVLLPAVVLGLGLLLWKRRFEILYGFALPVVVSAAASPAPWWARYVLTLPALGVVCLAVLLTALEGRLPQVRSTVAGWAGGSGVLVARRLVAGGVALAFVVVSAVSMWWATAPTHVWTGSGTKWHHASVREAIDLMRDPARDNKVQPRQAYAPIGRNVPKGETIALTENSGAQFLHLVIGDGHERRIDLLDTPRNAADLRGKLAKSGARYLLLTEAGKDAALLRQVYADPRHYRMVVGAGKIAWFWLPAGSRIPSAHLFEVGDFPPKA
ncbi:hypothetical protein LO772_22600 [Yinghuangia sp. ASG 101]|uniref:hypothetical protein n=1 Tax=Yinghuangia sp. ASG 101 TaxID=2896848 RepID=UPI001E3E4487|nr:hypothetical protein [Yinghuangia sp. ASG 101]UGQ09695.1 hypothetical protein LO772_22600 [Yinghuangia sp. ASG 101]